MRIVLLGAPGSGKGTQAKLIVDRYKLPQISTGDILRDAVASGSTLGRQAKVAMDAGQLVSDEIVLAIISERVRRSDARSGFILDGFPRNLQQAEALDQLLGSLGQPLNLALLMAVDVDALLQRLTGRRTCLSCGQLYNVFYSPPHIDGRCDACGGKLRHRADDNEETIGNRLRVYEAHTLPVIEYYKEQQKLRTVQGVGKIADIFKAVRKVVEDVKVNIKSESRSDAIRRAIAKHQTGYKAGTGGTQAKARKIDKKKAAPKAKPKTAAKKAVAKKAAPRKTVPKKAVAKKAAPRKTVPKKAVVKKLALKKAAPGKAAAKKKATPKKVAVKKTSVKKKVVSRKAAAKKKAAARKAAPKKSAVKKKTPARKAAPKKKAATKKTAVKKKAASRKKR